MTSLCGGATVSKAMLTQGSATLPMLILFYSSKKRVKFTPKPSARVVSYFLSSLSFSTMRRASINGLIQEF
jgi:hypothetical protein